MPARTLHLHWVLPVALLISGCAGSSPSGAGVGSGAGSSEAASVHAGVATLDVIGSVANAFDKTALSAPPGLIRVRFQVTGGTPHDFTVEGISGAATPVISGGERATITFTAAPGLYRFLCTIHPGTMRGTLLVRTASSAPSSTAG